MAVDEFMQEPSEREGRDRQRPTTRTSPTSARRSPTSGIDVDNVDVIVDVPNSGVALAVTQVARAEEQGVHRLRRRGSSDLTGPKCNANTVHWTYDTWMLANGTGKAIVKTGGDTWFFLTADYAFGHALERDTAAVVEGTAARCSARCVIRSTRSDFSSFLLQAQASKAKIIGLANAGGDTINSIKQARRVRHRQGRAEVRRPAGVRERRQRARPADRAGPDVHRDLLLGPQRRHPRLDQALAARAQGDGKLPTMNQAGVYSGILHYLKAVAALKSAADGKAVVAKMKKMPAEDSAVRQGHDPRRRPRSCTRPICSR